tara:strand:- start:203 stop:610 length:408 start_codon:yes stop_codon:yes gene_type:complete
MIMKKFFVYTLSVLFFLISPASASKWTLISTSENKGKIYVDVDSIKFKRNTVYFWQLDSYPKKLDLDKIVIFSSIGKIEGDCVKMARRDLYVSYHDKKMGKGNVVSEDKRTSEWIYNKPGSVWYETLKFVCNSKR